MPHLLLLDDDPGRREAFARHLREEGFTVATGDPARPLRGLEGRGPDAALLDLGAAGAGAVLAALRERPPERAVPVLLLGDPGADQDRLVALGPAAGGDFLVRPFGLREAAARVRALLRRAAAGSGAPRSLACNGVTVDLEAGTARTVEGPLDLTRREFELLAFLVGHPGRVLSRERILRQVWGLEHLGGSRTIDAHIRRLRAKLGDGAARIETVVGAGYRFAAAAEPSSLAPGEHPAQRGCGP